MVFSNHSALWNEIKLKGILSYQQISSYQSKQNKYLLTSPQNHLTQIFNQSPNTNHVKRKLFQNSTTNQTSVRSFFFKIHHNKIKFRPFFDFLTKFSLISICLHRKIIFLRFSSHLVC